MGLYDGDDQEGWGIISQILGMRELSIETLKSSPDQTVLLENAPYDELYRKCLKHSDGKVHCFPEEFTNSGLLERCEIIFKEPLNEPEDTLKMISMRTPYMHNTWFANIKKFRRGGQSINPLHMSPDDAQRRGLVQGDIVRVFNRYGEVHAQLWIVGKIRQGVVAMAHGYGPGRPSMRVAEANPGVNANRLVPNALETIEPLSNMSWIGAYPVDVEKG